MLYAHAELGHDQDVIYVLCYIQSKFFIPGVRKIINDMKKPCPGCIKLTKKSFSVFEAYVLYVLQTV